MAAFLPLALLVSLLAATATADYAPSPTPTPTEAYTTTASPAPPPTKSYTPVPPAQKDKVLVMVEGMVFCQSCACENTESLEGSVPLPKARVLVTCRDAKNRIKASRNATTDDNGYFLAPFDVAGVADYFKGDSKKACFARLVASPDAKCNVLTNINRGIVGAPVRDEGKRWSGEWYDTVVYSAGHFAFRPSICSPKRHY